MFHAGLREFMETHGVKNDINQNNGWRVTGLSISASKILGVPQVSAKYIVNCLAKNFLEYFNSSIGSHREHLKQLYSTQI